MPSIPQSQPNETRWLTPQQYAEKYQVHITTVERWVKAGRLPHMRNGKIVRIRDDEEVAR